MRVLAHTTCLPIGRPLRQLCNGSRETFARVRVRPKVGVALLVFAACLAPANGQEPGAKDHSKIDHKPGKESGVTSEVEQLSRRWYRAWLDKDAATVERLMADDYVYVSPTGQAQSREAILRVIRSPGYRLLNWKASNVVVRMLGDSAAVVRLRGQGEGEFEAQRFKEDHACLQVWGKVAGEWRVVVEQCTTNTP
jgi:uncharacterized protein (TIGR02246 family)